MCNDVEYLCSTYICIRDEHNILLLKNVNLKNEYLSIRFYVAQTILHINTKCIIWWCSDKDLDYFSEFIAHNNIHACTWRLLFEKGKFQSLLLFLFEHRCRQAAGIQCNFTSSYIIIIKMQVQLTYFYLSFLLHFLSCPFFFLFE